MIALFAPQLKKVGLTPRVYQQVDWSRGGDGIVRVIAHFGFREQPRIDGVLRQVARKGVVCTMHDTSFFTSKPTLVSVSRRGLFGWRRSLFGWLLLGETLSLAAGAGMAVAVAGVWLVSRSG